ncbi:MAG: peptidoglycan DD-metalloendopeptidase family protein [Rhodomicrobium sp.]|nr:peptidoglycan DD-metalloendopeptidase family protein [Rhodomicrobium sp.]
MARLAISAAAAGLLLLGTEAAAQQPEAGSASRVIRAAPAHKPAAKARTGVENRVPPKRRKGKEGAREAKMDAEQARELYIRRKLRLEQIQAQQRELSKDKRTLAANRARMHARLIETARALRLSEKRLTGIEERLAQTRIKVKEQREKLEDKSAQMSALFALMQGMSRQPPPVLITHSRDALKMIRSGMVLAAFYEDVEKLAVQITAEIRQLDRAQKVAELQEQRRKSEQVHNNRLKSQIDLLLIENREQLEVATENLENLKSATKINLAGIKSLEQMLPVLDAQIGKKANTAGGAKGTDVVSPDSAKVAMLQPGRMQPSIPFARSQGLLPLPVQGKMLVKFGQSDQNDEASKGVRIETRPGAGVVSPCDGLILYSGPFRSYGQLLIIDPGGGYHVVIAGMDRIQATQGQFVLAGEPVAVMGTEPRSGEKAAARPILYVEFRRDKQSIDPAPWWSAGGKG